MRTKSAFSLLEVMVAMAILTVGLVSLLQVQARSAQLAIEGRELTVATMLARSKLYDCQHDLLKKGFSVGDYDEDGNFVFGLGEAPEDLGSDSDGSDAGTLTFTLSLTLTPYP